MFARLPVRDGAFAALACFTQLVMRPVKTVLTYPEAPPSFHPARWCLQLDHGCHPSGGPGPWLGPVSGWFKWLVWVSFTRRCGQWSNDHTGRRLGRYTERVCWREFSSQTDASPIKPPPPPGQPGPRRQSAVSLVIGWREGQVSLVWFFPAGGFIYLSFPWFFFQSGFCRSGLLTAELELSVTPPACTAQDVVFGELRWCSALFLDGCDLGRVPQQCSLMYGPRGRLCAPLSQGQA